MLPPRERIIVFILTKTKDNDSDDNGNYSNPFKFIHFFFEEDNRQNNGPDIGKAD